jgi:transcriptional regulator with XRE-family HTH domain
MKLSGSDIVKRIDGLLASRNEKRQVLADTAGFSAANIAKWKTQGSTPTATAAVAIADYFGVSVRWLLTGQDEKGLTLDEHNLLVKYSSLDDRGQREIQGLLDLKLSVAPPDGGLKKVGNP